jgi:hypothetical protein
MEDKIYGILIIALGFIITYLKINKKILIEESRDDFYVPPHIIKFWGIILMMIIGGIILIFQNL